MERLAHRTSSGGSVGWHGFTLLSLLPLAECPAPSGCHLIWAPLTESQVHAQFMQRFGGLTVWGC